jgi:hypothetical protein
MNLAQLPDLQRMREECGNPRLKRYYDEAIRQTLASAADERLPHQFMRALLWVLLLFFFVTGAIGILAALQVIRADEAGLRLIWRTFVTSVVGLAVAVLRPALARRQKSVPPM